MFKNTKVSAIIFNYFTTTVMSLDKVNLLLNNP